VEGALREVGRPPTSWAPQRSRDLILSPIYTLIPQNHQGEPQKHFSTAATFFTREIPSRGLFQHPAGGDSIMEGFYINTIALPMKRE